MAAVIDKDSCTGCESCVGACPVEAIAMADGVAVVNEDECIDCGACVGECPVEAISLD
jgi:NAD-dependent dihydropyrimidine dehydrogenase PreA subunit